MRSRFGAARALPVFLCVLGLAQGCAYVTAVPVKPGSKVAGIRIYDVKPILVVSGSSTEVKIVPNYNRAYALHFGAFLAKNNVDVALQNGIPTQIKADMDTTKIIELLGKVADKLPAGLGLSGEAPRAGVQDRFQVYDIVFDDEGNLVGLRPLIAHADLLKVRTTPPMSQGSNGATVVPQPGATSLSAPLVVFQSPAAVPGALPATVVRTIDQQYEELRRRYGAAYIGVAKKVTKGERQPATSVTFYVMEKSDDVAAEQIPPCF